MYRPEIFEPYPNADCPTGPALGSHAGGDAVGKMPERGDDDFFGGVFATKRRLGADGPCFVMGFHIAGVLVPCERA